MTEPKYVTSEMTHPMTFAEHLRKYVKTETIGNHLVAWLPLRLEHCENSGVRGSLTLFNDRLQGEQCPSCGAMVFPWYLEADYPDPKDPDSEDPDTILWNLADALSFDVARFTCEEASEMVTKMKAKLGAALTVMPTFDDDLDKWQDWQDDMTTGNELEPGMYLEQSWKPRTLGGFLEPGDFDLVIWDYQPADVAWWIDNDDDFGSGVDAFSVLVSLPDWASDVLRTLKVRNDNRRAGMDF